MPWRVYHKLLEQLAGMNAMKGSSGIIWAIVRYECHEEFIRNHLNNWPAWIKTNVAEMMKLKLNHLNNWPVWMPWRVHQESFEQLAGWMNAMKSSSVLWNRLPRWGNRGGWMPWRAYQKSFRIIAGHQCHEEFISPLEPVTALGK